MTVACVGSDKAATPRRALTAESVVVRADEVVLVTVMVVVVQISTGD